MIRDRAVGPDDDTGRDVGARADRAPVPMMQSRTTAPVPTDTWFQRIAPVTLAPRPTTHRSPSTASGPTRQPASSRQPAPMTHGPLTLAVGSRMTSSAIQRWSELAASRTAADTLPAMRSS